MQFTALTTYTTVIQRHLNMQTHMCVCKHTHTHTHSYSHSPKHSQKLSLRKTKHLRPLEACCLNPVFGGLLLVFVNLIYT